ncbi:MAG TPA: neutral zinc metallopeptidase [Propionicimonas sp.]|uniref:neutral zinc metallopeptidase n=1 Tax=Propionicimonas sp. TaxID=1955623 RepID=UPI002F4228A4
MTQQWGTPGQPPGQGGQQWAGQPNWNRPTQAWGAPAAGQPQYPGYPQQNPQGAYPQGQPPYPQGAVPPQAGYGVPQAPFGQPAYGQPGGFQPANRQGAPGGPRRSSPFRGLLIGLVLVIGIAFFAISLTHYLGGGSELGGNQPTSPGTTSPPVEVPEPDYSPPPVPQPETYEQATEWLKDNAVYAETAPIPTDCQVPAINLPEARAAELTVHLNELTACLWRVWAPPLEKAGFTLPRPPVTVYTEPITTACGKEDGVNASYCAGDQHIYYAEPLYKILPQDQQTLPFVVDTILAHEFGHTIQARTGLLVASAAWEQHGTKAEGLVFSRRAEMQADCFAGMFTVAVGGASGLSGNDLANLQDVIFNIGDDVLTGQANYNGGHGLGKNRKAWFTNGQQNSQMGKCNTYVVPASAVR